MIPPTLFCDSCGAANQPKASFCRTCGHPLQPAGAASRDTTTGRLLPNHLLKQRYRILDSVGKGGMGAVYKGEDTQLGNRKVAIKEMSQSGLSPQEVIVAADDFKREAYILAGLQHPNLPNIYDHFPEAGRWYLVMSFIQGETLEDYLNKAKGGRLPVEEVLQIGVQLCTVLNYLHSQQPPIIFRDLKPSNIMRTMDGHVYLIDFGIARHFKLGQAKDTAAYGSIGYASPEQYGKAQTTPLSDIYSLGATLHQLLSGHDPSSSPFRFPLLQSLVPAAPTGLTTLITQMLELDEDKRPASMLLVKQELQALTSSPVPKPGLQTPAPSSASVAPTQPAKPHPGLSAVAPTQPASSPVASAQSAAKTSSKKGWLVKVSIPIAVLILAALIGGGYFLLKPSSSSIPVLHSSYSGTYIDTTTGARGTLTVSNVEDTTTGAFTGSGTIETSGGTCFFQVTNGLITADGKMTWVVNYEQSNACNAGSANCTGQLNDGVITGSWTNANPSTQDTGTFTLS